MNDSNSYSSREISGAKTARARSELGWLDLGSWQQHFPDSNITSVLLLNVWRIDEHDDILSLIRHANLETYSTLRVNLSRVPGVEFSGMRVQG